MERQAAAFRLIDETSRVQYLRALLPDSGPRTGFALSDYFLTSG